MRMSTFVCILVLGLAGVASTHAAPGDPVGGEFQVNTYTTGTQALFHQSVARVGNRFLVVWRSAGSAGDAAYSVQAQRFDGAGQPIGSEFQVNTYTTGDQGQAAVAPYGSGNFVVVWHSGYGIGTDPAG